MTAKNSSHQQRHLFLTVIPAMMAGYIEHKGFQAGIRPKIRPLWSDRLGSLLFNWLSQHFSRHCVAGVAASDGRAPSANLGQAARPSSFRIVVWAARKLFEANRELIARMEAKIKTKLAEVLR